MCDTRPALDAFNCQTLCRAINNKIKVYSISCVCERLSFSLVYDVHFLFFRVLQGYFWIHATENGATLDINFIHKAKQGFLYSKRAGSIWIVVVVLGTYTKMAKVVTTPLCY